MKIKFYEFDSMEDEKLKFAVIMAEYGGRWIFVRHKDRQTWEIPGGHREQNEDIDSTASRELYEETGAVSADLRRVCVYSVTREPADAHDYTESYGGLYYAHIDELEALPASEIAEISFFEHIPEKLTYPMIQPFLYKKIVENLKQK